MEFIKPFCGLRPHQNSNIQIIDGKVCPSNLKDIQVRDKDYGHDVISMLNDKIILCDLQPCFYVCRVISPNLTSIGIMAAIDMVGLTHNIIRHEHTIKEKRQIYVNSFKKTQLQTNPVLLIYKHCKLIDKHIKESMLLPAHVNIKSPEEVCYQLWAISDLVVIAIIAELFHKVNNYYVADGHHRLEALDNYYNENQSNARKYVASMLVSEHNVNFTCYNKIVRNISSLSVINEALTKNFTLSTINKPDQQPLPGTFIIYLAGRWLKLGIKNDMIKKINLTCDHDPLIADQFIFSDILKIPEQGLADNIEFISSSQGIKDIEEKVNSIENSMAILMPNITLDTIFSLANSRIIFPPNTTFFEPKFINGLISYNLSP